jgi:hypothetical protein
VVLTRPFLFVSSTLSVPLYPQFVRCRTVSNWGVESGLPLLATRVRFGVIEEIAIDTEAISVRQAETDVARDRLL